MDEKLFVVFCVCETLYQFNIIMYFTLKLEIGDGKTKYLLLYKAISYHPLWCLRSQITLDTINHHNAKQRQYLVRE